MLSVPRHLFLINNFLEKETNKIPQTQPHLNNAKEQPRAAASQHLRGLSFKHDLQAQNSKRELHSISHTKARKLAGFLLRHPDTAMAQIRKESDSLILEHPAQILLFLSILFFFPLFPLPIDLFLLKIILFLIISMSVCAYMCTLMCRCPTETKRGRWILRSKSYTSDCELPDVGAGI